MVLLLSDWDYLTGTGVNASAFQGESEMPSQAHAGQLTLRRLFSFTVL